MTIEVSRLRPAGTPAQTPAEAALLREVEELRASMASRATIEQAKGMLMVLYRVDDPTAFSILQRWSMAENLKIRDLAVALVHLTLHGDEQPNGDAARVAVARALRGE